MSDGDALDAIINALIEAGKVGAGLAKNKERETLQLATAMLETSVSTLAANLTEREKLNLMEAISGAFTIGRGVGFTSKSAASHIMMFEHHRHTGKMRRTKADKQANDPREEALRNAILAELGGRLPAKINWKVANSIRGGVNGRLATDRFKGTSTDTIMRRMQEMATQKLHS